VASSWWALLLIRAPALLPSSRLLARDGLPFLRPPLLSPGGVFFTPVADRSSLPKCLHCNDLFRPDPRNRGRQLLCSKPACRKASKRQSQARWLSKHGNADYFKGPSNSERVRQWRARNPGYWRRSAKSKPPILQESCAKKTPEPVASKPLATPTSPVALQDPFSPPLQDLFPSYHPVLVGLVALHLGSALQEDIRIQIDLLRQSGLAILQHGAGGRPSVS